MPKFKVPFDIDGHLEIEADTPEEATFKAWQLTHEQIAAQGALWMGRPEPMKEPAKLPATEAVQ